MNNLSMLEQPEAPSDSWGRTADILTQRRKDAKRMGPGPSDATGTAGIPAGKDLGTLWQAPRERRRIPA
jgi:hypothetical protein